MIPPKRQPVLARGVKSAAVASLLLTVSACAIFSDLAPQTQRMMEPSGVSVQFDGSQFSDFDDYISQTREHLIKHKVYLDPDLKSAELAAAQPFKLHAAQRCTPEDKTRGVVLIHGLGDTPGTMLDLANSFAERCFTVYGLLLPGHGARSSELVDVSDQDWIDAAQFAVNALKQDVDEVYIGGFSLGGLTATRVALQDSDITGLMLFSPALTLRRERLLSQTVWLRHLLDWVDNDAQDDAWRFEPMPTNGVAQTVLLSQSVQSMLEASKLSTPVFLAQSRDDAVIEAESNQRLFEQFMLHPKSILLDYSVPANTANTSDSRVMNVSSERLDLNILSYSHLAIHVAPDNPRYGQNGSYRSCGFEAGDLATDPGSSCSSAPDAYRGEVYGPATKRHKARGVNQVVRLTYNPAFDDMVALMDQFIQSVSSGYTGVAE